MRNDRTDQLGFDISKHFKKTGLTVKGYIEMMVKEHDCFDTSESAFHFVDGREIVSAAFIKGKWYAKY